MKHAYIICLLFPTMLFSQINIIGVIANHNKEPLPLTNIVLLRKNAGTITNEKGVFVLSDVMSDDSIKISNIAFNSKLVAVEDLVNNDTIFLVENIKNLTAIEVRNLSGYKKEMELGFYNQSGNGEFKLKPGNQLAIYIYNKLDKEAWIKGVSFRMKNMGKCKNSLRVRVLQSDTLHWAPSADLLLESVLLNATELKKSNYVDLSFYKIKLPPEGIFIVIEWVYPDTICDANSYSSLTATLGVPDNLVWFNFRDRAWSKSHRPRLPNGNYMTPTIGLNVAY